MLTKAFISDQQFGTMREVSAADSRGTKGISDELGSAIGVANACSAARGWKESVAESSNAQYVAAASHAVVLAMGTFAKLFQKYPAR